LQDVNELITVAGATGGVGQLVTAKLLEVCETPTRVYTAILALEKNKIKINAVRREGVGRFIGLPLLQEQGGGRFIGLPLLALEGSVDDRSSWGGAG
jgi:hypothetical protein